MHTGKHLILALAVSMFFTMNSDCYAGSIDRTSVYTVRSPSIVLQEIIRGNRDFVVALEKDYFQSFQNQQNPTLTVVTCADSRVQNNLFGMDPSNKIFTVRNIGNQIQNAEGSVDYGIHHLSTSILLVMGHSNCGAIKAAMGDISEETVGIIAELAPLKTPLSVDNGSGQFDDRWTKNIERNVDYQVAYANQLYASKVKSGDLVIIGAVYDFNNHYKKGQGALVITNINGETNPDKYMKHSAMRFLTKTEILARIGSIAPDTHYTSAEVTYGYHAPQKK
ncbi:MAG: carbonic anhydrase [Proteobacteria bacterium]|nr:carbonic anhydrase [Pseudomonadota bacterium]MBU1708690.1 carbonic anhydrase [Pseudomonadota bacterium]